MQLELFSRTSSSHIYTDWYVLRIGLYPSFFFHAFIGNRRNEETFQKPRTRSRHRCIVRLYWCRSKTTTFFYFQNHNTDAGIYSWTPLSCGSLIRLSHSGMMDPRSLDLSKVWGDGASNHNHMLRTVMAKHENTNEMAPNRDHTLKMRRKLLKVYARFGQ